MDVLTMGMLMLMDRQAEGRLKVICFVVDKANILSRKRNRDNAAAAKSLKGRSLWGIDATAEQKKINGYFCHSSVRNMTLTEGSNVGTETKTWFRPQW